MFLQVFVFVSCFKISCFSCFWAKCFKILLHNQVKKFIINKLSLGNINFNILSYKKYQQSDYRKQALMTQDDWGMARAQFEREDLLRSICNFSDFSCFFRVSNFFRVCFVFRLKVLVFVSRYTKHEHEVFVFLVPNSDRYVSIYISRYVSKYHTASKNWNIFQYFHLFTAIVLCEFSNPPLDVAYFINTEYVILI